MLKSIILPLIFVTGMVASISPYRKHISVGDQSCSECHQMFKNKFQHFYSNSDECVFCHETLQINKTDTMITIPSSQTCIECHHESSHITYDTPHKNEECYTCHNPHSSNYSYLLNDLPIQLCMDNCHTAEKIGRSHPVGENYTDKNTGSAMTCTSTCHRLHKPESEKLLLVESPRLCRNCHGKLF